jgi:hypothetical protein
VISPRESIQEDNPVNLEQELDNFRNTGAAHLDEETWEEYAEILRVMDKHEWESVIPKPPAGPSGGAG